MERCYMQVDVWIPNAPQKGNEQLAGTDRYL